MQLKSARKVDRIMPLYRASARGAVASALNRKDRGEQTDRRMKAGRCPLKKGRYKTKASRVATCFHKDVVYFSNYN